jgi:hypothetical protein
MFRQSSPRESILPLLMRHLPHSIVIAGTSHIKKGADVGLLNDSYFRDTIGCWTSFSDARNLKAGQPWCVLCIYTKPEDVKSAKTVDVRFYCSLERDVNIGRHLRPDETHFVADFLQNWKASFLHENRNILPEHFMFVFGGFHTGLILAAQKAFESPIVSPPWMKYIVASDDVPTTNIPIPQGAEFDTILSQHSEMMLSTSSLPRTSQYLETRISASTALYRNSDRDKPPMAFCITAPDRSMAALWVDPSYRGQGLGKSVGRNRLFGKDGMLAIPSSPGVRLGGQEDGKNGLSHADVAEDNTASRRVCEWLGGKIGWNTVWIRVEV